jgi:AraC-like DNA-binding protein
LNKRTQLTQRSREVIQKTLGGDVSDALQFIFSHFDEALNVEDVARAAHLSPQQLARKFKAALGMAPAEYLRRYRLQKASDLLGCQQRQRRAGGGTLRFRRRRSLLAPL